MPRVEIDRPSSILPTRMQQDFLAEKHPRGKDNLGSVDHSVFLEFIAQDAAAQALDDTESQNEQPKTVGGSQFSGNKSKWKKGFSIFVGDLSPDVDGITLARAFLRFGDVKDTKIVTDTDTGKPKGYGFVWFARREDAEVAIAEMNGETICDRPIRTNKAMYRWQMQREKKSRQSDTNNNLEKILNRSSPYNSTVYVGNLGLETLITEEALYQAFKKFGTMVELRVFRKFGYAFVKYATHRMAATAIYNMHGAKLESHTLRCSWGREPADVAARQQQQQRYMELLYFAKMAASPFSHTTHAPFNLPHDYSSNSKEYPNSSPVAGPVGPETLLPATDNYGNTAFPFPPIFFHFAPPLSVMPSYLQNGHLKLSPMQMPELPF